MKAVTILRPSFHGLRKERLAYNLGSTQKKKKKKRKETPAFLESRSAKASSTNSMCSHLICITGFERLKARPAPLTTGIRNSTVTLLFST